MDGNGVFIHHICHSCIVVPHKKQILQCDDAEQLPVFSDVTGINRLFIHCRTADAGKRLISRHVGTKRDILCRHDGTGGIVRIAENLVDFLAHLRIRLCENPLYDVRGHLFNKVNSVVDVEFIHDFTQFVIGKTLDQQLFQIRIHFHERFRSKFLREEPEQKRDSGIFHLFKHSRNIRTVHGYQNIL